MGGGIAHGDASVSQINIVSEDFRPIIARLFPVQYKAHRRWVGVGIGGLFLQDTESGDRVRGRCWCLAKDKLTVRPCSSLIDGLKDNSKRSPCYPIVHLKASMLGAAK